MRHNEKVFDFESLTAADLRRRGGLKWSLFGSDVLPLWVAEMDFPTAPVVQRAIEQAVQDSSFGYPGPAPELSEAFAQFSERRLGLAINPDWCGYLPDVLRGVELGIETYSPPGSAVVVTTPAYMPFLDLPHVQLGRPRSIVPLTDAPDFQLDLDGIDAAFSAGARSIILCQPYNPTGQILAVDQLRALAEIVDAHGAVVISDEIHAPLTRRGVQSISYASVSELAASHCVTVTAASKSFSIPGLNCAVVALHTEENWKTWRSIPGLRTHGTSPIGITASTAAFTGGDEWLDACRDYLDDNQRFVGQYLGEQLPEVGWTPADGTYFAWLDFRELQLPPDPAAWLRSKAKVALNSGPTFGPGGEGFARLNFATSRAILTEALDRITAALAAR